MIFILLSFFILFKTECLLELGENYLYCLNIFNIYRKYLVLFLFLRENIFCSNITSSTIIIKDNPS